MWDRFVEKQGGNILVETRMYLNYFSQIPCERLRKIFAYWKFTEACFHKHL